MQKLLLTIFLLFVTGCAPTVTMPNHTPVYDASYQQIIELPELPKQQIFERSKQWMARTFISPRHGIEYDSLQQGKIIGNGSANLTFTYNSGNGGPVTQNCAARFLITEDIKDGKARITFDQIL